MKQDLFHIEWMVEKIGLKSILIFRDRFEDVLYRLVIAEQTTLTLT